LEAELVIDLRVAVGCDKAVLIKSPRSKVTPFPTAGS